MCFIIHEKYRKVLIADKDIVCYKYTCSEKVNTNAFVSCFQSFFYLFNKLYKRKVLRYDECRKIELCEGFHSYIKKPYIPFSSIKTIRCIIPKGARYLKNPETGEYISNMIIPIKVVRNKH